MKIILIEDMDQLGHQGDIIDVKPGYARNFLIPKGIAWEATKGNMKRLEQQKRVWEVRQLREKEQAEKLKEIIETKTVSFEAKVGDEGHLYGSITAADISTQLESMNILVDKRKIHLAEPIKREGKHEVTVKLHREVEATVNVEVVPEGAEEPTEE